MKLTKKELGMIQYWLGDDTWAKGEQCPFDVVNLDSYEGDRYCFGVCSKLFRRCIPDKESGSCPCSLYSLKYVKQIARRTIKMKGVIK